MVRTALEKQWLGSNNHAVHDGHAGTGGGKRALKATLRMIHFALGDAAFQKEISTCDLLQLIECC